MNANETKRYLEPLQRAVRDIQRQLYELETIPNEPRIDDPHSMTAAGYGRYIVRFRNHKAAALQVLYKLREALYKCPPRKPKINRRRPVPVLYRCYGGPFDGERIFLSCCTFHGPAGTLHFMGGRYAQVPNKPGVRWQADAG